MNDVKILRQIHEVCDIDSRKRLEKALGWPFIRHKLPRYSVDIVGAKSAAGEIKNIHRAAASRYYREYYELQITIPFSDADYIIHIMKKNGWTKMEQGKWCWRGANVFSLAGDLGTYMRVRRQKREAHRYDFDRDVLLYSTTVIDMYERTWDRTHMNRLHETQSFYSTKGNEYTHYKYQYDTHLVHDD